jgi:hypothetical protein
MQVTPVHADDERLASGTHVIDGIGLDGSNVASGDVAKRRHHPIVVAEPDTAEAAIAVTQRTPVGTGVAFETAVAAGLEERGRGREGIELDRERRADHTVAPRPSLSAWLTEQGTATVARRCSHSGIVGDQRGTCLPRGTMARMSLRAPV